MAASLIAVRTADTLSATIYGSLINACAFAITAVNSDLSNAFTVTLKSLVALKAPVVIVAVNLTSVSSVPLVTTPAAETTSGLSEVHVTAISFNVAGKLRLYFTSDADALLERISATVRSSKFFSSAS